MPSSRVSSGIDMPARWARKRTASTYSRFSMRRINVITSPPAPQPKQ